MNRVFGGGGMKRRLALAVGLCLALTWLLAVAEVAAKNAGGGFRSGNRATREEDNRSFQAAPDDGTPGQAPDVRDEPKRPGKPKTWRSFVRGLLRGGLVGSIFYGRGFRGVGVLDVAVLSGLIVLAFWALSRYQIDQPEEPVSAGGYGPTTGSVVPHSSDGPRGGREPPDLPIDTTGVAHAAGDIFLRVQAAWTARDIAQAADVLTVEVRDRLDRECGRLRASRRINRVERITLGPVAVTEARQQGGWDRVTVQIVARLVDYTTDEMGLKVLEGNPFDPVPFQERWELMRPSGPHPWRVSAIQ